MNELCRDIPNLNKNPLHYVFENIGLRHREDTLWLEFGVYNGETINYISRFTPCLLLIIVYFFIKEL